MDLLIVQFLIPMTMNMMVLKSRLEFHAAMDQRILLSAELSASERKMHVVVHLVMHTLYIQTLLSIGTGLPKIQVRICRI